jgi:hypothetical protein
MVKKINYCLDCDKLIWQRALRCSSCSKKGRKGPFTGHKHNKKSRIKMSFKGNKHYNWKGGIIFKGSGGKYLCVWMPTHPYCDKQGYVRLHRLIMERSLGRFLKPKEVIHHLDGNKLNNNLDNLKLFSNSHEHFKEEQNINQLWKKRRRNNYGQFS